MKRRDAVRIIPAAFAGLTARSTMGLTEMMCRNDKPGCAGQPLAVRYLDKVRDMLTTIRETQSDTMLEAAYLIARTIKNKGTCWYSWDMGHSVTSDIFPGRPGVPAFVTVGFDSRKAKKGDCMLASIWSGATAYISGMGFKEGEEKPKEIEPADVKDQGVLIIGSASPWGLDAKGPEAIVYDSAKHAIKPSAALWIETNITKLGAVMELPGAGAPIGPVSGIIGMATYWMIAADVCRILARDGISLAVDGDEPDLGKDVPRIGLNAPLMDDYFAMFMRQHEMIGAEMGDIRKTAALAIDTVLNGGKVYCYSRDRNNLAYESQTRRGGLALTRGMFDENGKISVFGEPFKGTSNDIVIMGIDRPDHDTDLRHLDEFRSAGCKVIAIGPMTRDGKIPGGRTVPKEADIHLGLMCDTYGLYAVPGFKRKICPTSGAMLNQLFWATCLEIAEGIVTRTGNVPGVYLTGAVTGGLDHLARVNLKYEERGY